MIKALTLEQAFLWVQVNCDIETTSRLRSRAVAKLLHVEVERLQAENKAMLKALKLAEAGLADIGDADREPGDDLAWCERRAAEPLPIIRAAIAKAEGKA